MVRHAPHLGTAFCPITRSFFALGSGPMGQHTIDGQRPPMGIIGKKQGRRSGRSGVLDRGYAEFRRTPLGSTLAI